MGDLVYSDAVGRFGLAPVARWGYRRHRAGHPTPRAAYRAMRKLYGGPTTAPFDALAAEAATEHPLLDLGPHPAGLVEGRIDELVAALRADGFVRLPGRLPEADCADLEAAASAATCRLTSPTTEAERAPFDPDRPIAVRYDLDERDVAASEAAQRIVTDASLLALAQRYLGAAPIIDLLAMWWSAAVGGGASSAAAQQFHFDLDRLRFLKLFVYLTDVDLQNGPHVYVRGSQGAKPAALRHDGRHGDAEVEAAFPGRSEVITGPRGSMFLADTLGLHKGRDLAAGHRLVFQVEWASSLFGAPFARVPVSWCDPAAAEVVAAHPWAFQRFDG
jgi:hypothetical protein